MHSYIIKLQFVYTIRNCNRFLPEDDPLRGEPCWSYVECSWSGVVIICVLFRCLLDWMYFLLHNTRKKFCKTKDREQFITLTFFAIKNLRKENVLAMWRWHVAATGVELDFVFCPKPISNRTGLVYVKAGSEISVLHQAGSVYAIRVCNAVSGIHNELRNSLIRVFEKALVKRLVKKFSENLQERNRFWIISWARWIHFTYPHALWHPVSYLLSSGQKSTCHACTELQTQPSCVMSFAVNIKLSNFDVLLTVHLSIILVINQLDAQNLVL